MAAPMVFVGIGVYAYIHFLHAQDYLKNPERVEFILNLSELPSSVRDIECSAWAITDVIVTCAFKVDPKDHERLLSGWDFKSEKINGSGRAYGMDAPAGEEFTAAIRYTVRPSRFENGGEVNLVTNEERSLVVANRYEE